jgi:hypothetical protein
MTDTQPRSIRRHLAALHAFEASDTDASLARAHDWDHKDSLIVPDHDLSDLSVTAVRRSRSEKQDHPA